MSEGQHTGADGQPGTAALGPLPSNVLTFIWHQAPAGHIRLFALVLLLLPFNYASLELPRLIVNGVTDSLGGKVPPLLDMDLALPDWLGGAALWSFPGFTVSAFGLLTGLAATLLALQLIQQHISRIIEMDKARLGERIIVRLRRALFDVIQRLRPEAPMKSRALETGNMLRFEVGPVGPFSGMAFAQPLKSVGLIGSAVLLIFTQNSGLGLFALVILGLNYALLDYQRRDNAAKLKAYQRAAVALGKRVSSGIDALPLTHGFATSPWERSEVDAHLAVASEASLELKRQNTTDRVLNLLLSDFPTLVFYFAGGWLALSGSINIGQLVAVVAAYGQIPEPLKEIIDWDERRVIAQVRYDFARYYLETREVWPERSQDPHEADGAPFTGAVKVADLSVTDPAGRVLLDDATFEVSAGTAVALRGPDAGGKHAVARVLGRAISLYSGSARVGGHELAAAPEALVGRHLAYAGGDPILLTATLRENMQVALRRLPGGRPSTPELDLASAHLDAGADVEALILEALALAGLDDLVLRLGLERRLDPDRYGPLCGRIVSLRANVTDAIARRQDENGRAPPLIEPFRFAAFNHWMSLSENILFAAPHSDQRGASALLASPGMRPMLDARGLTGDLMALGEAILALLTDLAGGPEELSGLDTKGLIRADEGPDVIALAARRGEPPTPADAVILLRIAGRYCEPRHRLGLLDETWRARALSARSHFAHLKEISGIALARYQTDEFCPALTVRDNLLFGRIVADRAGAQSLVDELVREALIADGMMGAVERLALDIALGEGGIPLSSIERGKLTLARCLLVRPDILVIDDALAPLSPSERATVLARVVAARHGRTTLAVLDPGDPIDSFQRIVTLEHGAVTRIEDRPSPEVAPAP